MHILNLYSGIGGNRKLWENVRVTAVECDVDIANVYQKNYPDDIVILGDALVYLENHYKNFDFIWASPPCQSHGQYRHRVGVLAKDFSPIMPDMSLYAIIVFLKTYYRGKYVVENTKPYYDYLICPTIVLQRHPFWTNFNVTPKKFTKDNIRTKNKISDFDGHEIVNNSNIKNKRQVLRNCVRPEIGEYLLQEAIKANIDGYSTHQKQFTITDLLEGRR